MHSPPAIMSVVLLRMESPELRVAVDAHRDQSYFLFATTQAQLDYLRFPLGDLEKTEVRDIAERFGLVVADKPDSQDICFVPNGSYANIVQKLRPGAAEPGDIVHVDGRVLGRHDGLIHYTVGQRPRPSPSLSANLSMSSAWNRNTTASSSAPGLPHFVLKSS